MQPISEEIWSVAGLLVGVWLASLVSLQFKRKAEHRIRKLPSLIIKYDNAVVHYLCYFIQQSALHTQYLIAISSSDAWSK